MVVSLPNFGQGVFQSNGSGSWNSASGWTLVSGSDADGIPDSNDDVTIISGHNVSISAAQACNDLTFNNGTISFSSENTLTVNGNVSVMANSTVAGYSNNHVFNVLGNLSINSGITLSVAANTFSIAGTTTVNGVLAISGYGAKPRNFGDLTINVGATMTVAGQDIYTFNGDVTNNGTFTANDQTEFRFTDSSGMIAGSNVMNLYRAVFNSPASYTNTGNLIIRDRMTGTGSFANGGGGALELQNGGPFSVSTFDASAVGNTITYTGYGNPTSFSGDYYNLVLNKGSGNLSFGASLSVLNDLTIQSGALSVNAVTLTIGNDLIMEGGEFTPDNASAVVNIGGGITITGGEYDHNNGDVNATGALTVTGGSFFLDGASSTLDVGSVSFTGVDLTLSSGSLTSTGDFNINTGTAFNNTGATINAGGTFYLNDGTAAFPGGNLSAGAINIASGEELILTNVATSVTGVTTVNGTITFDGTSGTKNFGSVTVGPSGLWSVTQPNSFTISGDITNNGTFTGDPGHGTSVYTLTSSSGQIGGSGGMSIRDIVINSPASYTNTTNLIVAQSLTGTGTFINSNGASLTLQNTGPFSISNFDASAAVNTVTYSEGGNPALNSGDYYNLTINKTWGALNVASTATVTNDLTIVTGIMTVGAATLNVSNDILIQGGEFSPDNASAVINVGRDTRLSGGEFDFNGGDMNVTGDLVVTGGTMQYSGTSTLDVDDFTVSTGTVNLTQGTVNVNSISNGLTVNSGTFTMGGATLAIDNLYHVLGGTNDFNSGNFSTVNLNIATSQVLTVASLTSFLSTGAATISGTFTVDGVGGTKTFNNISVAAGGVWNNNTTSSFTVTGDIAHNGASWLGCSSQSCNYTLTDTNGLISGVSTINVSDIVINGAASYTNTGVLAVTDRLTGSGTFINGVNGSLNYSGNNSGGANFNITNFTASATGNTVTFSRAGNQQLRTTTEANNNYHNVVINTTAAGYDVTLAGNITIDNSLTLNTGDLRLANNRLTLSSNTTVSGGNANSYISLNGTGVVRQSYMAPGGTIYLPMGDVDDYSPITSFTLTQGTLGANPYIEFDVVDASHPNRNTGNTGSGGDDDGTAAASFISRYWPISGNDIANPRYEASYQYTDGDVNGTEADMVSTLRRPITIGMSTFNDWLVAGTVNPTNNTVTMTKGDGFGDMYAMDDNGGRLPIVLLSFIAEPKGSEVSIKWSTASEENNQLFTVERSINGTDFEPIIYLDGAGSSQTTINYSARDKAPEMGRNYYRLKQTDTNGKYEYSEVVSVFLSTSDKVDLNLYPNPVEQGRNLNIEFSEVDNSGLISVILISTEGKIVVKQEFFNLTSRRFFFQIPSKMKPGVYYLKLITGSKQVKRTILVN